MKTNSLLLNGKLLLDTSSLRNMESLDLDYDRNIYIVFEFRENESEEKSLILVLKINLKAQISNLRQFVL